MIGLLGRLGAGQGGALRRDTDLPWIAVNVSPLQLRDEAFAAQVLEILSQRRA